MMLYCSLKNIIYAYSMLDIFFFFNIMDEKINYNMISTIYIFCKHPFCF